MLERLTLPTLGQYEWTYRTWYFAERSAGGEGSELILNETAGVRTKKALAADGSCVSQGACTWRYQRIGTAHGRMVTVIAPTGDFTVNYESEPTEVDKDTWTGLGLRSPIDGGPPMPGDFVLSQEVFNHSGTKLRSIYLAYEHDQLPPPRGFPRTGTTPTGG